MQKYIFDGEAVKIGLETKNLVACMSFMLEQKLVSYFPSILVHFLCSVWLIALALLQIWGVYKQYAIIM